MQEITGAITSDTTPYAKYKDNLGKVVTTKGTIHNIRLMSVFAFIILRSAR